MKQRVLFSKFILYEQKIYKNYSAFFDEWKLINSKLNYFGDVRRKLLVE